LQWNGSRSWAAIVIGANSDVATDEKRIVTDRQMVEGKLRSAKPKAGSGVGISIAATAKAVAVARDEPPQYHPEFDQVAYAQHQPHAEEYQREWEREEYPQSHQPSIIITP